MENATIARPYAEAVFVLADAGGVLDKWSGLLAAMAAVAAAPEMRDATGNPNLSDEQLYGIFVAACGGALAVEAQNFVRILIENDRLDLLSEIRALYEELKDEREGIVNARISTAFPLDEAQVSALVAELERYFKRKVKPQVIVDKQLIGGVRMQVGDEVIDGSVRGKLITMAGALKN
jgi:F-type H+-transporting ATPase subunit delta